MLQRSFDDRLDSQLRTAPSSVPELVQDLLVYLAGSVLGVSVVRKRCEFQELGITGCADDLEYLQRI